MGEYARVESFTLPDGRVVNVNTGKQVKARAGAAALDKSAEMVVIPSNREATKLVVNARRKLVDLPDMPRKMNAISAVVSYTLFGLDDDEIAVALGIEVKRVRAIKMLDAYNDMQAAVVEGIKSRDMDPIAQLIEQHSGAAVERIVALLNDADDEKTMLDAAKDLLDRSGRRPVDVREHRHIVGGGLLIEHVERSEHAAVDNIVVDAIDADFLDVKTNPDDEATT